MAKKPPRDPSAGPTGVGHRGYGEGRSLSDDPIARNLRAMIDKMKEEPLPDELQSLMDDLAAKLDEKSKDGRDA